MKEIEIEIIDKMCECSMNVSNVAKELYMHRNSIVYQLKNIKDKYGLDPCCFWDLIKLSQIAGVVAKEENLNIDDLLKVFPTKKREAIRAVLKAKTVIIMDTEEEKE